MPFNLTDGLKHTRITQIRMVADAGAALPYAIGDATRLALATMECVIVEHNGRDYHINPQDVICAIASGKIPKETA